MRKLRRLAALPADERRLRFEAARATVLAALLVAVAPSRWLLARLGRHGAESPATSEPDAAAAARRVATAVASAAHNCPGKNACLVRAVAAARLLTRRGLPWTLYLGMARDDAKLVAHAWVRSGAVDVTGGAGAEKYAVVATFARDVAAT